MQAVASGPPTVHTVTDFESLLSVARMSTNCSTFFFRPPQGGCRLNPRDVKRVGLLDSKLESR